MKYGGIIWPVVIFVVLSIFVITACEKKSRVNPFDPSSDTDFTPQNVQVAQSGVTTVTLTWELEDALIQGFKIDRKVGSGEWQTDYAVLDADAREWSDDDILPSNMYYYRLYGYADENVSEAIEVNITPGFPGPTDLDAQPYLVNQVKLTWTDVASGEAGYKIDKRVGSTGDWVIGYGETGADAEEWIDSSAVLDNILYYRVYAYIGELVSGYDEDSVNLSFPAPTNLTAVQESVKKVTLSWDDNSDGEDGFVIEKHTSTEEWIVYDNVAGDISQWSDSTLAMNTETFYRVHAYKDSDLSGTVSASITPVFPAPSNLQVILNELATITLSWNDNSVGEDGFRIDRQVDGGTWAEGYQTVGTDVKEWTDTNGIEMGKQYAYRVTAFTTDNMSAAAEGSITNVVPVPENVMISQPDVSTLRLTWTDSCAWETGFRIDKKIGDGIWEEGHVTLPPDTQQWQDTSPVLGQTHSYRIMTLYNSHSSSASEVSLMADIPGVENLTVVPASPTELILNWEDKAAGEQGYKIERKVGASGTYGLYATLGADIESYSDTSVGQDLYSYKVYPYYGIYNSSQPVEGSYDMSTYGMPIVYTSDPIGESTSVVLNGNAENNGGYAITSKGFCWGENQNPDFSDNIIALGPGLGEFSKRVEGLSENTYYVRAFAINSTGTSYGENRPFYIPGMPNFANVTRYIIDDDRNGDSDGNDDGRINVGETIELSIEVINLGTGTAHDIQGKLIAQDSFQCDVIQSETGIISSISPNNKGIFSKFVIELDDMTVDQNLDFSLLIECKDGKELQLPTQTLGFTISPIYYGRPSLSGRNVIDIDDDNYSGTSGNNNGQLDWGEKVEIDIEIINEGEGAGNNVQAHMFLLNSEDSEYCSVNGEVKIVSRIDAGDSGVFYNFEVDLFGEPPVGTHDGDIRLGLRVTCVDDNGEDYSGIHGFTFDVN